MKPAAGRLRHRITIQRPKTNQDPDTGSITTQWIAVWENVPAEIVPSSVREFIASQQMQSQVTARITILYREGLTADMRIIHRSKIYNPQGWLADPDTGLDYLTAPCSEGTNDGV